MRIAISHKKSKEEVKKIIDKSATDVFNNHLGAIQLLAPEKRWEGDTLFFSFTGQQSVFKAKISGRMEVTDTEVIVNIDLPEFLANLLPEAQVRSTLESRVRGLLA